MTEEALKDLPANAAEMRFALEKLAKQCDGSLTPYWARRFGIGSPGKVFRRLEKRGLVRATYDETPGFVPLLRAATITEKGRALLAVWELRKEKHE